VTAKATGSAPAGEAGFRLLADQLPDLIILAFDPELKVWAATGGGEDPAQLWSLTFVPLVDAAGRVGGGMVLCRDVTEPRRAEQLLRDSQRRLAEAQRIAQIGSWEWDVGSDELAVSEEMARILGLQPGPRLDMRDVVTRFVHPADLDRVLALLDRVPTDPAPFTLEHRIVRSDGTVRSVLVRGEGVVDEHGRVVRLIGTDQDVTDRRRADAERRRLLGRVYEAQEGQDRRLAADLHDGHVQSLAAIGFKLEQARLRLGASGSPEADELLWQVTKDLSDEVTSLRRTIGRLRPLVLVEDGLEAALREEAKSACNRAALATCEVTSELEGGWTRWSRRPCSGSPSRPWPTSSTTPRRPTPWSPSSARPGRSSCGSATTAAASTPTTSR
jgi:PAS domain S-box-containing protein